jgi:hypothetical protein
VNARARFASRRQEKLPQLFANRIGECDVRHMPRPKNVCSKERFVRSTNWFGSTMSHGLYFTCSEPTALTLTIHCTPSFFIAQMFARWFSSLGRIQMPARVSWQKHDLAPGEFAGEQLVGRRTKRRLHRHPFLVRESLNVVQPTTADYADAMVRFLHASRL